MLELLEIEVLLELDVDELEELSDVLLDEL